MDQGLLKKINAAYSCLEQKQTEIVRFLSCEGFEWKSGWYNGHYQRDDAGNWQRESYPIPVIGVKGVCDIEIEFEGISVSAKLKREEALEKSFEMLAGYEFEAYGVQDYLADFYCKGQTVQEMKEKIRVSDEAEIGFSAIFPPEMDGNRLFEFVKLLRQEKFYNE